jgi:hypothetical protein
LHFIGRRLALIPAVGDCFLERCEALARNRQERSDRIAILNVARRD